MKTGRDCLRSMLLSAVLVVTAGMAAEPEVIVIAGPARVNTGAYTFFQVTGLSSQDILGASVLMTGVSPDGKTVIDTRTITCIPFSGWGGGNSLFVVCAESGNYTIRITVNGWRDGLDHAVSAAVTAKIDVEMLGRLQAVQTELAGAYPFRSGSATLEVVGANPPPPPPPAVGKRWIILLYETQATTPALSEQILTLRESIYLRDKGHRFRPLDADLAPDWVRYLGDQQLPALVIAELAGDNGTGQVLYKGPATSTSD